MSDILRKIVTMVLCVISMSPVLQIRPWRDAKVV
jgi:hypothetical protein